MFLPLLFNFPAELLVVPHRESKDNSDAQCYTNEKNIIAFRKYQQAPWEIKL